MGFFASKTLLSAVELDLFTELSKQPMTGTEIAAALDLSARAVPDFPDALVALGFLQRAGEGADARYSNTPESAMASMSTSPARTPTNIARRARARCWSAPPAAGR